MTALDIQRPCYGSTDLAAALAFNWSGWHLSEKMDGVWTVREFGSSIVTGETMRDGSFYGFDIVTIQGQDVRGRAWLDRGEDLRDCAAPLRLQNPQERHRRGLHHQHH